MKELSMAAAAAKEATFCLMDGQFERSEMWLRPWAGQKREEG